MEGQGQDNENRQGTIRRQQSNWAQEITNLARNLNATITDAAAARDDTNNAGGPSGFDSGRPHPTQEGIQQPQQGIQQHQQGIQQPQQGIQQPQQGIQQPQQGIQQPQQGIQQPQQGIQQPQQGVQQPQQGVQQPQQGIQQYQQGTDIREGGVQAPDLSNLSTILASMTAQMESIESSMEARARGSAGQGEPSGAYGSQVYASVGSRLEEVQETSSATADRLQELSQQAELPPDMLDRSSSLVSRVQRAALAHRAGCPPHELERRMSQQFAESTVPYNDSIVTPPALSGTGTGTATAAYGTPAVRRSATITSTFGAAFDSAIASVRAVRSASSSSAATAAEDAQAGDRVASGAATSRPSSSSPLSSAFLFGHHAPRGGLADGAPLMRQLTLAQLVEAAGNQLRQVSTARRGEGQSDAGGDGAMEEGIGLGLRDVSCESMDIDREDYCDYDSAGYEEGLEGFSRGDGSEGAAVGAAAAAADGAVSVYSFGRGDLGALMQSDDVDHGAGEGPVTLREHWSVLQVSTALFHTMAVTASGDVIGCGQNDEGQVRSDLPAESVLPRPSLLEPLLSHRVTQVACGLYHTACVTAAGVAITWGGNESGQLGHSPDATRATEPRAIHVKGAGRSWSSRRRASRVACGDLFTLVLTSRAELLSCGVGDCVGGDGTDRKQAELVQSLAGFPTVWMACGNSHSVVIGAGGEAMAFGLNTHGQLGVGPMAQGEGPVVLQPRPIVGTFPTPPPSDEPSHDGILTALTPTSATSSSSSWRPPRSPRPAPLPPQSPRPTNRTAGALAAGSAGAGAAAVNEVRDAGGSGESGVRYSGGGGAVAETGGHGGDDGITISPPAFRAYRAACGQSHTVLVSTTGEAWACGRNRSGQLGLDPVTVSQTFSPVRVPLPSSDDAGVSGVGEGSGVGVGINVRGSASRVRVVQAAAGRAHTILLRSNGCVLGFGSDEFGALGFSTQVGPGGIPEGEDGDEDGTQNIPTAAQVEKEVNRSPVSMHWKPREISALKEQWVAAVSAGGEQSFALVVGRTPTPQQEQEEEKEPDAGVASVAPSTAGKDEVAGVSPRAEGVPVVGSDVLRTAAATAAGTATATVTPAAGGSSGGGDPSVLISRQGSEAMYLRRHFSLPPAMKMRTAAEFLRLIEQARSVGTVVADGAGLEYAFRGKAAEAAVLDAVRQTFGSPSVLSGCFNVDPPSNEGGGGGGDGSSAPSEAGAGPDTASIQRVDTEGLESVYAALMNLGPRVVRELWSSIEEGMDVVVSSASDASFSPSLEAGVSFLLKYWQSPTILMTRSNRRLIQTVDNVSRAMAKICMTVLGLKGPARWQLMRSAKEDYPPALFSSRLVKPMVAHLAGRLRLDGGRGPVYPTAALLLKWLHSLNTLEAVPKIPYQDFFSDAVSSMPVEELLLDVKRWKAANPAQRVEMFFISEYAFLISTETKTTLLRAEEAMEQRQAATDGGIRFVLGVGLVFSPYFVLQVNRSNLLQDTLAQVAKMPDQDLRKKLKVVFRGEEGVDEGGVTREFFQLLILQLFDQSYGMFLPAGEGGESLWFNKGCVWADENYKLVGLVVGLAVYAGVILDVPLPLVVFRKVLGQPLSLRDLGDVDPGLLQGFENMRDYDGGDDEDVFSLAFRVTWDDFGGQRSHDLKEGGENVPVTAENKEEYIELYAKFLLVDSVSQQFECFKQGFMRIMRDTSSVSLFRAEELEVLVTGTSELDFGELEKATVYDGGFDGNHPTIVAFWSVVNEMNLEEQKKLLMFVTGCKKAPLGGLGKLTFKIQRAGPDTNHLPTAHTCFNSLMLPDYGSREKLSERLKLALTECEGFGLR